MDEKVDFQTEKMDMGILGCRLSHEWLKKHKERYTEQREELNGAPVHEMNGGVEDRMAKWPDSQGPCLPC